MRVQHTNLQSAFHRLPLLYPPHILCQLFQHYIHEILGILSKFVQGLLSLSCILLFCFS